MAIDCAEIGNVLKRAVDSCLSFFVLVVFAVGFVVC